MILHYFALLNVDTLVCAGRGSDHLGCSERNTINSGASKGKWHPPCEFSLDNSHLPLERHHHCAGDDEHHVHTVLGALL
jgi:hypothetical protein